MKTLNWDECVKENDVLASLPDIGRAKSLVETANARVKLIREINEKNCNFVFEDYYTSILELLQAITFLKGFKVKNHVCLGFFLRDVLNKETLFRIFDDLRYKRNMLVYYGNRMDYEVCKEAIQKCKKLLKELKILIKNFF